MSLEEELLGAILALDEEKALEIARRRLEAGEDPARVLEALRVAADRIGEKYEQGEFFIADLVLAGEILRELSELAKPKLAERGGEWRAVGRLLIGTVEGDIHDIGKNIVSVMAEAAGFEVIDLGVDVPPARFVEAVRQYKPDIVGLSGLLSLSIESMKRTVDALREAGLRDGVKVIVGGRRVDEHVMRYTGADAWADDAASGVRTMLRWMKEKGCGGHG